MTDARLEAVVKAIAEINPNNIFSHEREVRELAVIFLAAIDTVLAFDQGQRGPQQAESYYGPKPPDYDTSNLTKEATLIAENIVMRWTGARLTEADIPLVLAIAGALCAAQRGELRV